MDSTTQQERISIIDSLRGMALLGILMMNIPYFSTPYNAGFDLSVRNEFSGPDYWSWWAVYGLFEGTMRGTFSMLFGAGCLLLLERLQSKHTGLYPADIYYRRLLILIGFGLFNAFILNWPGDILFSYGVCGLFLFPFRKLKPVSLVMMGTAFLIVATLFATMRSRELIDKKQDGLAAIALEKKGTKLTEEQKGEKEAWEKYLDNRKPEAKTKKFEEIKADMHGGYFEIMGNMAAWNIKFETFKLYTEFFWDAMGFFFFGMALFKWQVLTGKKSVQFYLIMALLGLGIGLPLSFYGLRTVVDLNFDFASIAETFPIPFYQLRRLLVTLGNIGLFMAFYRLGWFGIVFKWLSRVGQMAFSNYLTQSVICSLIFYGYGLGYFGELARHQTYYVVGAIWLFQIILSNIWLHYFRFGYFEWVWRSLTYGKKQPMVRTNSQVPIPNFQ